ncbi:hypothetical protein THASP1DRAFT_5417, partial [Thamnocephalis sphaerospora]
LINVLIAGGSGEFGSELTRAFLADSAYQVSVLSRAGSQSKTLDDLRERGARIVHADYDQHSDLVRAMQGIDILVSAIFYRSVEKWQPILFRAAKDAGVRRIVPSDFAPNTPEIQTVLHSNPDDVARQLAETGLEYTRYYCGWFYNYLTTSLVGVDLDQHRADIIGAGNTPISIVHQSDVAHFVAASL